MADNKTNHFTNSNECNKNLFLLSSELKQHAHNNDNKNFEYYKIGEDSNNNHNPINTIKDSSQYENSKSFLNYTSSNNLKQPFISSQSRCEYAAEYSPYQVSSSQYQSWNEQSYTAQISNPFNYGGYSNVGSNNGSANYSWSLSNQNYCQSYNPSYDNTQFRSHQSVSSYDQMNSYNANLSSNCQQNYNFGLNQDISIHKAPKSMGGSYILIYLISNIFNFYG